MITSSPGVSCQRQSRTVSGETLDGAGAGRSSGIGSASEPTACSLEATAAEYLAGGSALVPPAIGVR